MATIRLTMAQALVRYLSAQKVATATGTEPLFGGVWAIFGHGNVAGLGEALYAARDVLPTYRAHNEQGMALAATAFAKAHFRRRLMAVTTSIGPGCTNLVTAAATAHVNRLPMLLLPGDMPLLQTATLSAMGQAVTQDSLVFPEYRYRRGHPVGFSAEFYSELIRLQRERDLQRLLAKYPARAVNVDDAGILMTQDTDTSLAVLRSVLQGHASLSVHR